MPRAWRVRALAAVLFAVVVTPSTALAQTELRLRATGAGAAVDVAAPGVLAGCAADGYCRYQFHAGETAVITAVQSAGSSLALWQGGCAVAVRTCSLVMTGNRTVVARFTPVRIFADESTAGGTVTATPAGTSCGVLCWAYPFGATVTLRGIPDEDHDFVAWDGPPCSAAGTSPCRLHLLADAVTAGIFCVPDGSDCMRGGQVVVKVYMRVNVTGGGSVTVNGTPCSSSCRFKFTRGRAVVLKAVGGRFVRFLRDCRSLSRRCQVTAQQTPFGEQTIEVQFA